MSLDQVPDDVIQLLLYYVAPEDNLQCFQLLSRRLRRLANQALLWRYHCCTSFKFWSPEHQFAHKLREAVASVDWKDLYRLRAGRNRLVSDLLEGIMASPPGRLRKIERICRLGYDAKDFLLLQCNADEADPDVLARRYFSKAVLDGIHRSIAIEEWYRLGLDRDPLDRQVASRRLERALGAFDMFVLHDQPGDLDDISRMLDDEAARFLASDPVIPGLSTRDKALALKRWLRVDHLTGLRDPQRDYGNLRNCLIGQALQHADQDSIPLISNAIYCCLASRVGLNAQCSSSTTQLQIVVFASPGRSLDDEPLPDLEGPPQQMCLDTYDVDDNEASFSAMQSLLFQIAWQSNPGDRTVPIPHVSMVLHIARHIKATFARVLELQNEADVEFNGLLRGDSPVDVELSQYSAQWAFLMLTPPNSFEWDDRLVFFLRHCAGAWPEDVWLVDKYLWPIWSSLATPMRNAFTRRVNRGHGDPWEHWRLIRHQDELPHPVFRRNKEDDQAIPFKIGQVFRHRRYRWIGVITGWSDRVTRRLPVTNTRESIELPFVAMTGGERSWLSNQFYFMCFPSTGSEPHVVADESIELIQDATQISDDMFPTAGKFFKRFDRETCTFVSNIRGQYPDD